MHTWEHGRTIFTGNSDFSGDIVVTDGPTGRTMDVPAADILALAARFVRSSRIGVLEQLAGNHEAAIAALEEMDDRDMLGVSEDDWRYANDTASAPEAHASAPDRALYVSSKLRHRGMWLSSGLPIVSSWIQGEELPADECSAMWDRYRDEIEACDGFVLYAEPDDRLKGCMIELALAFGLGRPIVIVWEGSLETLADKIGTIVHHESVTVVGTLEAARALLG